MELVASPPTRGEEVEKETKGTGSLFVTIAAMGGPVPALDPAYGCPCKPKRRPTLTVAVLQLLYPLR